MRRANRIAMMLLAVTIGGAGIFTAARADLLSSVVKGGLVAVLVKQFSGQINDGLNKLTDSAGAPIEEATKVVPILSVGNGSYVGAAQVSGPKYQVDKVQAVGMLEGNIAGGQFRLKALIPVGTTKLDRSHIDRVKGVGVSAIIDVKV